MKKVWVNSGCLRCFLRTYDMLHILGWQRLHPKMLWFLQLFCDFLLGSWNLKHFRQVYEIPSWIWDISDDRDYTFSWIHFFFYKFYRSICETLFPSKKNVPTSLTSSDTCGAKFFLNNPSSVIFWDFTYFGRELSSFLHSKVYCVHIWPGNQWIIMVV